MAAIYQLTLHNKSVIEHKFNSREIHFQKRETKITLVLEIRLKIGKLHILQLNTYKTKSFTRNCTEAAKNPSRSIISKSVLH